MFIGKKDDNTYAVKAYLPIILLKTSFERIVLI